MEGQVVCEDERTSDDGPPSNSSSVQDSIVNGDELDKESNQSSSNEHPEESSPEESFISDKQQLHGRHFLPVLESMKLMKALLLPQFYLL